jgi:hypothetical protein
VPLVQLEAQVAQVEAQEKLLYFRYDFSSPDVRLCARGWRRRRGDLQDHSRGGEVPDLRGEAVASI